MMSNRISEHISGTFGRIQTYREKNLRLKLTPVLRELDLITSAKHESGRFRIAHLTDMHFGRVTPMRLQKAAIDTVNQENPDAIMLTGDFVCHSDLFLEDLTHFLSQLNAPAFAVLGNHDHWTNPLSVKKALKKANIEVLENENTIISLKPGRLQIVGLDDPYTNHHDVRKATRGLNRSLPTIGLSHIAEEAANLWPYDIDLVLSGHTHAGQVTVARINELLLGKIGGHKYIHGLYQNLESCNSHQSVYVGAGVGSAVIPFRLGEKAKSEVTLFNLETRPKSP